MTVHDLPEEVKNLILERAYHELHWDSKDERHDNGAWKDDLRKELWEKFHIDLSIYT